MGHKLAGKEPHAEPRVAGPLHLAFIPSPSSAFRARA